MNLRETFAEYRKYALDINFMWDYMDSRDKHLQGRPVTGASLDEIMPEILKDLAAKIEKLKTKAA